MSSTLKPWLVGITIIGGLAVGTVIHRREEREREGGQTTISINLSC